MKQKILLKMSTELTPNLAKIVKYLYILFLNFSPTFFRDSDQQIALNKIAMDIRKNYSRKILEKLEIITR